MGIHKFNFLHGKTYLYASYPGNTVLFLQNYSSNVRFEVLTAVVMNIPVF
jgi:hypothetical protein